MPSSTVKRVVVYRFDRQPVEAFVNPASYLSADGIELLTAAGSLQIVSYSESKALCFGTEPVSSDLFRTHTAFERRPKMPGLWVHFIFRDGDQIEGVLSHNLLEWPEAGYLLTPPRASAARQRIFVPRHALTATELRGVIGASTARRNAAAATRRAGAQLTIFD